MQYLMKHNILHLIERDIAEGRDIPRIEGIKRIGEIIVKILRRIIKQARKARRCDSNLQSETTNHSLTHSLTDPHTSY